MTHIHTDLTMGSQHIPDQFPPIITPQDRFKKQAMIRFFEGREFAGVESAVIVLSLTMTLPLFQTQEKFLSTGSV